MAQPIYFLPNIEARDLFKTQRLAKPVLVAAGLAEIFADVEREGDCAHQEWRAKGPGGKSGVLLCALKENPTRDIPQHWGYYPQHQKWELRTPGLPTSAYIGWNPDQPPTPEDLRRKKLFSGYGITLGDGQAWQVPIIRRPDDSTELPREMYLNEAGALVEPIADPYLPYWEESGVVCQWFLNQDASDEQIGFDKQKAFRLAVRALGLNYRFGHAEQRICKAVNSENFCTVLAWSVDSPRFSAVQEAAKKKPSPAATPSTTPGHKEDSPGTVPAEPTSG